MVYGKTSVADIHGMRLRHAASRAGRGIDTKSQRDLSVNVFTGAKLLPCCHYRLAGLPGLPVCI